MTTITHITLEATDPAAAEAFYATAFDLGPLIRVRASDAASTGFRGYTLSLIASQPANVTALVDAAVAAGATVIKPVEKSMWGFGGAIQAPDGAIWTIATSSKKDTTPASRAFDSIVLLLGVDDVGASKKFYVDHGFTVRKSFGSYLEFEAPATAIQFSLYKRKALAKNAGVAPDGSGSHRIAIGGAGAPFTDPDGFIWES